MRTLLLIWMCWLAQLSYAQSIRLAMPNDSSLEESCAFPYVPYSYVKSYSFNRNDREEVRRRFSKMVWACKPATRDEILFKNEVATRIFLIAF